MKKKKIARGVVICLLVLVLVGSGIAYTVYNKASDYLLQETIGNQVENSFAEATGVDLSESGRILSEEEREKVEPLLKAVEKVADSSGEAKEADKTTKDVVGGLHSSKQMTTDEVKEKLEKQVTQVIKKIPTKDKNAMINLVLSNLSMSDISHLASLAADGISGSDIAEAKGIALRSFSKEEIERVRDYYYEYSYLIP